MDGSQSDTLTLDPSFDHNLCYKYSTGSCEPILDIMSQEIFNDIRKFSIQWVLTPEVILWKVETLTSKMGVCLGVHGFILLHSLAFSRVQMWLPGCILNPHLSVPLPWSRKNDYTFFLLKKTFTCKWSFECNFL
jgi:hypothetical protein